VVNTSPLIALSRAGMIDLLRVAGDEPVVPAAVVREVGRRDPDDPAVQALRLHEWLIQVDDAPVPDPVRVLPLDPGEVAVISWALAHPGAVAILDDRAARRHALAFGIPLRGTLSLILEAKDQGLLRDARPAIERVRQVGLRLSDRLVAEALRRVGE
jgi:predicted nucleic acid-binding protein